MLVFDVENKLASDATTLTAGYGADGPRTWNTDGTGTTYYQYDKDSTSPVCELNSSGAVVATNTYSVNGLLSMRTSSGSTFYQFDPQGNVAGRLNASGGVIGSSVCDAEGVMQNSTTSNDPFGYVAKEGYVGDLATGLYLTTFRYYDPSNGRFLNRDPSGYDGGIDLYTYVNNNDLNRSDENGLGQPGSPTRPWPPSRPRPIRIPPCKWRTDKSACMAIYTYTMFAINNNFTVQQRIIGQALTDAVIECEKDYSQVPTDLSQCLAGAAAGSETRYAANRAVALSLGAAASAAYYACLKNADH